MANQIKMSPDLMRERANEYDVQGERVSEVISKLDELLNRLQEEWEGNASLAYAEKFSELRPGFVEAQNLIENIAHALRQSAKAVESTDQTIASQFLN